MQIEHPDYYLQNGLEVIDFIEAYKLNFNLGNVVKYVARAGNKGNRIDDLRKAQWYLNHEIEQS